jgi:hypothetical protein
MELIANVLNYFFNFFLFFAVFVLLVLIITDIYIKKFDMKKEKLRIYGMFLNLSNVQIISFTLITLRFVYIFYSFINIGSNYMTLTFIMFLTIVYNIINIRALNIFFDSIVSVIIYLIILSKDIFIDYIIHVNAIWYAVILFILATLFGITVSLYLYIRDIMYILKKNIYVKKEAEKIDEENAIIQTRYIDSLIDDLKTKVGVDNNEGRFKKDHK